MHPVNLANLIFTILDTIKEWEEKIYSYRQYFEEEDEQFGCLLKLNKFHV